MGDVWEWIKAHPWITGGVVGVVLLWIFWPRGGGEVATNNLPSEAIAAGAQVQMAQNAANAQIRAAEILSGAELAATRDTNAATSAVLLGQIDAQRDIALSTNATAIDLAEVQAGMASALGNLQLQEAQYTVTADVAKAGLATQLGLASLTTSLAAQREDLIAGLYSHGLDTVTSLYPAMTEYGAYAPGVSAAFASIQGFLAGRNFSTQNLPGIGYVAGVDQTSASGSQGGISSLGPAPAMPTMIDLNALLASLSATGHPDGTTA